MTNSRKLLIIIAFLILLFIIVLIVLIQKKEKQRKDKLINSTIQPTTYFNESILPNDKTQPAKKEIVDKVNNWLKSMKNSADDQYYYALLCSNKKNCQLAPTDKQVSIAVLWSQYEHYKESGDETELNQIKQDIVKYSKRSEIEDDWLRVYQPDFWHCRFLYEMAKDSVFNDEYKNHLKNICQNNNYFLARINLLNILNSNSLDKIFPKDPRRFAIYNTMISDFVSMYHWFDNNEFLKIAETYFINAKEYYLRNNLLPSDSAYLTTASLDLYLATKDKTYLGFANDLYNRFTDTDRNALDINQLTEFCLTSQIYYDNISKNRKYFVIKNDSLSRIINKGFDDNKGAFHSFNLNSYSYETRNNALLMKCLIDQK